MNGWPADQMMMAHRSLIGRSLARFYNGRFSVSVSVSVELELAAVDGNRSELNNESLPIIRAREVNRRGAAAAAAAATIVCRFYSNESPLERGFAELA